jgi:predicted dienelactone hydrolase
MSHAVRHCARARCPHFSEGEKTATVSSPTIARNFAAHTRLYLITMQNHHSAPRSPRSPRSAQRASASPHAPACRWGLVALALLHALASAPSSATVAANADVTAQIKKPDIAATATEQSYRAVDMLWTDAARQRDVPVRLYWPDGASAAKPVPLVVFSHGLGGSRNGYSYLGQYWASLGFASLHVQHAGSDRSVWTGNIFKLFSNMQTAASEANAVDRAKDVSFAITSVLAAKEFGPQINASAIAVAGHSYGANTAMLIGGATVERDGKPLQLRDERVKALILISAPPFTGEGDMGKILATIKLPTLHVTGTDDVIRVPGYYSDVTDRVAVFDAMTAPSKLLTIFKGATHSIFTDRSAPAGFELNAAVKKATRELSGLFLKTVLGGASSKAVDEWVVAQRALLDRSAGSLGSAAR